MAKIDLKLNPPKDKRALTKENMLDFIKKYGTDEDKAWFVKLMNDNKKQVPNNLDKEKIVTSYKFEIVREEFAKRFFPGISKKGKKDSKKKDTKKPSFEDELNALLK